MYSLIKEDDKGDKKAKGSNKDVIKKMNDEEFIDVPFKKEQIRSNMNRIQSKSHQIRAYHFNKFSLSCFDDKKYILDDGIKSFTYRHRNGN